MKVGVIGLGKLGCSMLAVFASSGNKVYGYDINSKVCNDLKNVIAPVDETNLQFELTKGKDNYIICNSAIEVLKESEVIYIIVPTPSLKSGRFDTKYLEAVLEDLSKVKINCKGKVLVITSTVLPGDTKSKLKPIAQKVNSKLNGVDFIYSPEFIALGSVINDLKNPDFILVGEDKKEAGDLHIKIMKSIVNNKNLPIRRMSIESAEMSKIAINTYITSKITFANAIGIAADNIKGCNSQDVLNAIGSDSRIGIKYFSKGLGYGGPCFPRDNRALQQVLNQSGSSQYSVPILNDSFNKSIPLYYSKIINDICLSRLIKNVVIIGITYKDGSCLVEESQSYLIAKTLKNKYKLNISYYDNDLKFSNQFDIDELDKNKLLEEEYLIVNCSREEKKLEYVETLFQSLGLNYFIHNIW